MNTDTRGNKREMEHAQGQSPPSKELRGDTEKEGHSSEDEETPRWAQSLTKKVDKMVKHMDNTIMKAQRAEQLAIEAKNDISKVFEEVKKMDGRMTEIKAQTTTNIEEMRANMTQLRIDNDHRIDQEVKVLQNVIKTSSKDTTTTQPTTRVGQNDGNDEDEEERAKQIIIHGFLTDTDETTITTTIQKMIDEHNHQSKVDKILTFTDPSKIGVIQFRSRSSKQMFYTRMKNVVFKLPNERNMSWSDNNTFEERSQQKHLGYIKHHLMTKFELSGNDVRINRKANYVKLRKETVAKIDDGTNCIYLKEALEVQKEVEESMKQWLAKYEDSE